MKFLFMLFAITTLLSPHVFAHGDAEKTSASQTELTDKDIMVKINGMSCEPCADTVNKVFRKEDGVANTSVSLEDQILTIDTKDDQDISDAKIKELVEWGGYDLVSIERLK